VINPIALSPKPDTHKAQQPHHTMPFIDTPTLVIAGWSEDGTNVTFPIASLPELTASEADGTTGDSRKILYAILAQYEAWYRGLAAEDKPGKLNISRSSSSPDVNTGHITRTFSVRFTIGGALDVVDE
jgi:hypothetical protein